jgi:hypothetical protein
VRHPSAAKIVLEDLIHRCTRILEQVVVEDDSALFAHDSAHVAPIRYTLTSLTNYYLTPLGGEK